MKGILRWLLWRLSGSSQAGRPIFDPLRDTRAYVEFVDRRANVAFRDNRHYAGFVDHREYSVFKDNREFAEWH